MGFSRARRLRFRDLVFGIPRMLRGASLQLRVRSRAATAVCVYHRVRAGMMAHVLFNAHFTAKALENKATSKKPRIVACPIA